MEDDFNTPRGLAALFDLARAINRSRDPGQDVDGAQATLRGLAGLLGLRLEKADASGLDAIALSKLPARFEVACGGADVEETMEALLAHRERGRARLATSRSRTRSGRRWRRRAWRWRTPRRGLAGARGRNGGRRLAALPNGNGAPILECVAFRFDIGGRCLLCPAGWWFGPEWRNGSATDL